MNKQIRGHRDSVIKFMRLHRQLIREYHEKSLLDYDIRADYLKYDDLIIRAYGETCITFSVDGSDSFIDINDIDLHCGRYYNSVIVYNATNKSVCILDYDAYHVIEELYNMHAYMIELSDFERVQDFE